MPNIFRLRSGRANNQPRIKILNRELARCIVRPGNHPRAQGNKQQGDASPPFKREHMPESKIPVNKRELRDGDLWRGTIWKQNREGNNQGRVTTPPIQSEPNRNPITNNKFDMSTKIIPYFHKISPELGTTRARSKKRNAVGEVLSFENVVPQRARTQGKNTPPPLNDQTFFHYRGVQNAQPPKAFRLAHKLPFNEPIFLFIVSRVLEKIATMFFKPCVGRFREAIKTHEKHRKGKKGRH